MVRLHLTKLVTWSNRDEDWKNTNSLFQWRFLCRRRRPQILRSLLMAYHSFWTQSVAKPNERRMKRFFLEHLRMQSHLEPRNWHIHLYFFFSLTTTTKHSACCDMVKCPQSLLRDEGQRFQEVIEIDARLLWFLLQKVALWETSHHKYFSLRTYKYSQINSYLRYQPPLKLPFFHIWGFNVFK